MRELHRSPHFILTIDDEHRVIRRARTELAFSTLAETESAYDAMLRVTDRLDRSRYAALADLRLAPPRNDPAFEQFVAQLHPRLYGGYRRSAALVKTQAGRLQLMRIFHERGLNAKVFMDEAAALAYLTEPDFADLASSTPASGVARLSSRRGL